MEPDSPIDQRPRGVAKSEVGAELRATLALAAPLAHLRPGCIRFSRRQFHSGDINSFLEGFTFASAQNALANANNSYSLGNMNAAELR
jgi:hypothetical protein